MNDNICNKIFIEFLIRAKKSTYANSSIEKDISTRLGSSDYNYEEIIDNNKYTYHDTYFGGTKFMGEEVVYCNIVIPVRGVSKLEKNGYTYTFKHSGTIDKFDGVEQIYKDN